jgi:hypothetical protein
MEETKLKMVVDRTKRWLERERSASTRTSSSGAAKRTQLVYDEVNEVVDCIMDHPSSEFAELPKQYMSVLAARKF